jgi:hypothetical protein
MTAASYTTRPFAPPARTSLRWTLALLGVCLPVPMCAVSGLSLPLPATVERLVASLVPWADGVAMSANEALHAGAGGSIVADPDELSGDGVARLAGVLTTLGTRTEDGGRLVIPLPGVGGGGPNQGAPAVPGALAPAAPDQGRAGAQPTDSGDTTSNSPAAPGESPAPAPAPTTPTEPTQPPVQSDPDPVAAVKPVVDEAVAPLAPIVEDTTKTVEETIAPVVPVLPVLGK